MLISAVMPTRSRQRFAAEALACFLSQTYREKELLILDDIEDPSFPEDPHIEGVSIWWASGRMTIAEKRNELRDKARGEILFTLDDDDWSDPTRMADQIQRLKDTGKAVTGYGSMMFYDGEKAYQYRGPRNYALGTSLCYLRSWALSNPFTDSPRRVDPVSGQPNASDNAIVSEAAKQGQLSTVDCGPLMVARMHPNNTSTRKWTHRDNSPSFRPIDLGELPVGFPR